MGNVTTIGIIGEGKMGSDLFYYLLPFDFTILWLCSNNADVTKMRKQFYKRINRSLKAGIINSSRHCQLTRTLITQIPADLNDCDLIIEAIPENLEMKRTLFTMLQNIIQPNCIFASNSSSINPSELCNGNIRNDKFVGLHFFYPIQLTNIVEFIRTSSTSDETLASVELFLKQINRQYLMLEEKDSFILNKIFLDFQNEAYRIVKQGSCTFHQMDQLVKSRFFQFGVFDFFDSVGIDTMLASIINYLKTVPDPSSYKELISELRELVNSGKLGIKSKSGFYIYPIEEFVEDKISETTEIYLSLQHVFFSSVKRYSSQSGLSQEQIHDALHEYFG
ncbi:MAG: 3-hydroxyacyl-CoA dehydrogenase family protein [Bacteroidales bacterium]|nr:3-hydroxyacyl-CoA dehydrogenase family protein [Bacteroidales bacterium]